MPLAEGENAARLIASQAYTLATVSLLSEAVRFEVAPAAAYRGEAI